MTGSESRHGMLRVAALGRADLDDVLVLEQAAHVAPWSRGMMADELERPGGIRVGIRDDAGRLLGMLLAAPLADAWHVLDVAVHPERRREGLASSLLAELVSLIADDERGCTLEVRRGNEGAQALYARHGFASSGIRPRYYLDGEDAVVMWRAPGPVVTRRNAGETVTWEPPT